MEEKKSEKKIILCVVKVELYLFLPDHPALFPPEPSVSNVDEDV